MFPALKNGDCVFIFKAAYGIKIPGRNFYFIRWALPQLNDIIVYGKDGHFTVKRCSGISSSPIEFSKNLRYTVHPYYAMTVNGRTVMLTGVQFRNLGGMAEKQKQGIPEGYILALGDNLTVSYDSRDYGFISADGIYGKVLLWK